ncbi:MAG: hypothetical protein HN521_18400, partial [Candidatus Latescibacteria bacterium]|nr:hypothetical protein [Candidatus Latescibacterota bacterium]
MAQIDNQTDTITLWGYSLKRWSFYTYILLSVHGFMILATFLDYGLTTDEPPLLNYGLDILRWYKSGFTYQPIFETTNTWLLIWEGLSVREAVRQFVPQTVAVVAVAYVVMLPLWPWAMMNPITGP